MQDPEPPIAGPAASLGSAEEPASIWAPQLRRVTVATLTTVAITAFDGLSVVAALPAIGRDLGEVALLPWVVTLFVLVTAISTIVGGPLIDGWGAQRTFRVGVCIFLVASVLCTIAPTMHTLIAARAGQSLGLGLTMATAITTVGLTYPSRLRPRAFAAQSMVWGLFGFGGPPLVALAVSTVGWRGVFAANLPVGVFAAVTGWNRLPTRTASSSERLLLDWGSVALLSGFSAATLIGLSSMGSHTVPLLAVAVALAATYWHYSATRPNAVLSRRHLTTPQLWRWNVFMVLAFAAGIGPSEYLAVYARGADGYSEGAAALFVLFLSTGWTAASILAGRALDRHDPVDVSAVGIGVMLAGLAAFGAGLAASVPIGVLAACQVAVGLGIGAFSTSNLTAMQTIAQPEESGRVNAANQFLRNLGISYGVAFAGAILLAVVQHRTGDVESVRQLLQGDTGEDEAAAAVSAETADAIRSGYAWAVAAALALGVLSTAPLLSLRRVVRGARRSTEDDVAGAASTS